ncbi:dihydrofolate reductase family protein [Streptomyces sp. TRM66268-LWL]|uniref:Dihydrofolate reductase family protein n=1 Tax=Streptomyces polyasparticus TaxID=2767826 RepID=A0ABR7SB64_9ACTN|nr:dihydrofolate reductase family protein [Streptomyces polyasparticus]MBC9711583.1 dihydrofolate reductase family protein [Streptomyces polyasparticus]
MLIHFLTQSADGYIEGPDGEFDWPHMGPELSAYSQALGDKADAFLYGRKVWDMMSGFWPKAEEYSDDPHDLAFAPIWRAMPKYVVSRTLEKADWNTEVISTDVAAEVAALKEGGKQIMMFGGSELATELTDAGLIDEWVLVINPVFLGGGKPAYGPMAGRTRLRQVESRVMDGKVTLLRFVRENEAG